VADNNIDKYLNLTTILFAIGLIIVAVGVYFTINDMSSSGVTMTRYGNRGTGTLDGKGMIFCGVIIAGFGLIFRDKNKASEK
jgi:hypothetical protein